MTPKRTRRRYTAEFKAEVALAAHVFAEAPASRPAVPGVEPS
ncbi:hypothetical protein [Hymenobacter antarcticus]